MSACFRRVGKGESLTEIARDLHRRGRPTSTVSDEARAKRLKNHGSLPRWTPSRVYAIVRNARLYADGEWRAPGFEGVIRVPPLVTAKEAAAADLALASHGRRNKKRQKQQYLCQGILRCDLCRANVAATYAKPQSKTYLFYVCARRRRRPIDAPACTLPILRAEEVDARVWAKLTEVLENPAYLEGTIREQQMSAEDRVIYANDLAEAEARLREYDRRCGTLLEQYKAGRLPEPVWQQHLTSMNRERAARVRQVEAARAGIDLATQRAGEVENIMEIAQRLQRRLRSASFETRRELVQALIPGTGKHVITVDAKGRLTMNVVFAAESDHLPVFGEARKSDTRRGDPAAQT
ncbi:MAG TPA: zinc ribbon domain-containing protein [Polyangia bacterium]